MAYFYSSRVNLVDSPSHPPADSRAHLHSLAAIRFIPETPFQSVPRTRAINHRVSTSAPVASIWAHDGQPGAGLQVAPCSPRSPRRVDASDARVYSETPVAEATVRRLAVKLGMNLPNSLTLLRIFFVPLLIVILLTRSPTVQMFGLTMHFEVWGVLILLLAAATDWADGYLARRRLQVTTLGILLDPIADKLLISAAFIALVDMHGGDGKALVPAWMVVIIIGREFTVLGLRNIASAEGFTISASALGKTKMVLQVLAVAVLIASSRYTSLKPLGSILLWLVVASALISAAQYFFRFWSQLDSRITQRRKLRMMEARAKSEDVVPS